MSGIGINTFKTTIHVVSGAGTNLKEAIAHVRRTCTRKNESKKQKQMEVDNLKKWFKLDYENVDPRKPLKTSQWMLTQ